MISFNQEEFNNFVLDRNVIGFFKEPRTLASGRESHWYANWRNVASDVCSLDILADYVLGFIENTGLQPDCYYGVPEGATKLGIITQYKLAMRSPFHRFGSHSLAMGRGKPKNHGDPKNKYFIGQPIGKTIVLEDVTTTGGSLLRTIDNLLEVKTKIIAAVSLINRMELGYDGHSIKEAIETKRIPYLSMSNALELLPKAYKLLNPGENIAKAIEEEFERYGVEKLKLI